MGAILKKLFSQNCGRFSRFFRCNIFMNDGIFIFFAYYENWDDIQGVLKKNNNAFFSKTHIKQQKIIKN